MRKSACLSLLMVVAWTASDARAGLWEDIYRGLELVATPSGSPVFSTGDGTRVNGQRQGRLRILPNAPGQGWTIDFERTFGTDTVGNPEILDLGAYELELSGNMQARLGYTSRGMLIGNADIGINNVNYSLRAKGGLQDAVISGQFRVESRMEVNELGFYDMDVNLSNTESQLTLDGVVIDDSTDLNWDVGPINIKGNLYYDALVGVLGAVGADTSALEDIFPASPIGDITDALQSQLHANPVLGDLQFARQYPPIPEHLAANTAASTPNGAQSLTPEPGALALLAAGGLFLLRRR